MLKQHRDSVDAINHLESDYQHLSDNELHLKTAEFRERLLGNETLNDLLPEAFAAVREAATRTIGQRHYDAQIIGGLVLNNGNIAEMKTGEGKTLVATLPLYLNALEGKGVHLVTVNDYLAKRDTEWMGPIFSLLGLRVGCLQHDSSYVYGSREATDVESSLQLATRREAYAADITYGTNNEFGFDYLRDNMATGEQQLVQRGLSFAIVDEVDNILIDEARTPLIISGPAQQSTKLYQTMARVVSRLHPDDDYTVEERERSVVLTENGVSRVEKFLNIENMYDPANYGLTHFVDNAMKAHVIFQRDKDYVVKDGEVIIVDEFTGRLMPGRRYSEGLHQAIEAKENVRVRQESITYATITLQNYFRLYAKLAGMTGTAVTEAEEFFKIYKLEVVAIPTHRPMIREDVSDLVYKDQKSKLTAVADQIVELHQQQRPVLVGTTSIEMSEILSGVLKRRGVQHNVLNAKQHEKEAGIVTQAGRLSAVTVATNMAGRGTDIVLGGSPEGRDRDEWEVEHRKVLDLGGLYIIGTERHESRRIDNQLRGRSGRQGDAGASRFYVSLEDELMRRFGGDRMKGLMERFGMDADTPLESGLVSKAIEQSQVKVEAYNFDIRKHLVDYDDVVNLHRSVIYGERKKIIQETNLRDNVLEMVRRELLALVDRYTDGNDRDDWDVEDLHAEILSIMPLSEDLSVGNLLQMTQEEIIEELIQSAERLYETREGELGSDTMRILERTLMLRIIDSLWVEHLMAQQNLRESIGLQAFGQRDPLVMYKKESHDLFEGLLDRIQHDTTHMIYHLIPASAENRVRTSGLQVAEMARQSTVSTTVMSAAMGERNRDPRSGSSLKKVGRNDPCYCGSGKKFKRCHGLDG